MHWGGEDCCVAFDIVSDGQFHTSEFGATRHPEGEGFWLHPANGSGHITIASMQLIPNPSRHRDGARPEVREADWIVRHWRWPV
jgi:hypothetical protein